MFLLFTCVSCVHGCWARKARKTDAADVPALSPKMEPRAAPGLEMAGGYLEEPPLAPAGKTLEPRPRLRVRWWMPRVRHLADKVCAMTQAEWLFVGDSITENWLEAGEETWRKHFAARSINVGVAGDRTENILWRLHHGHLPENCGSIRWVVVLAGTNNLSDKDTPAEVARGIGGIMNLLLERCPAARILLMGIFPRSGERLAAAAREVNSRISRLHDGQRIFYIDMGSSFLRTDGSVDRRLLPDGLHLSPEGYRIWARAILPVLEGGKEQPLPPPPSPP